MLGTLAEAVVLKAAVEPLPKITRRLGKSEYIFQVTDIVSEKSLVGCQGGCHCPSRLSIVRDD